MSKRSKSKKPQQETSKPINYSLFNQKITFDLTRKESRWSVLSETSENIGEKVDQVCRIIERENPFSLTDPRGLFIIYFSKDPVYQYSPTNILGYVMVFLFSCILISLLNHGTIRFTSITEYELAL